MSDRQRLYPLTFEPELKEKVWGGRKLAEVPGKDLPPNTPIGESWEVHGESVVAMGQYAGRSLDELRKALGEDLLGSRATGDIFPLLFKYIDASEYLSVQVHPDDEYAQAHTGYPYGKTEAWYVLHAEPDAQLVHGWKERTTADQVAAAVRENRLEDLLEYISVSPGDVVFVPAGTVHAIGSGIVLGEIQQNSDTTYRLYDWGRVGLDGNPRDLHVEESLRTLYYDTTEPHKIHPVELQQEGTTRRFLVACRYFVLERLEVSKGYSLQTSSSFQLISALDRSAQLQWADKQMTLESGRTALLPAALTDCRVVADQPTKLLRMYVPNLDTDVIQPLRSAGYGCEVIAGLGGDAEHNDLVSRCR